MQFGNERNSHLPHHSYLEKNISIPAILFNRSGQETFEALEGDICTEYVRSFSKFLYEEKCGSFCARVVETFPDGGVMHGAIVPI